uniref:FYVE-type domain-containing protein n=1 Tax=Globisporangium ultimum (strain ATCC 200006 / CBS 805.95 / DAOM BR144) TaxID=431595 RepID=K3WIW6_GLOUD
MHVLERDERLKLDATCDLILSDALEALAGFNGTLDTEQWRTLGQRDQLTTYRSVLATTGSKASKSPTMGSNGGGTLRILATGHLNSSLAHVTSGLYSDTSLDYHAQQCIFYAAPSTSTYGERKHSHNSDKDNLCPVIDAAVLYAAECESRRTPFRFAGVKWCAWRTKDSERDLLAYERSGVTLDNEGREITYHIIQSFDRPYALEFKFPPGLRRMKLSVCFLYREVCEDLVECFALGEYSAKGSGVSQRAEDTAVSDRILTITKALSVYNAKRLSRLIEKNRYLPILMSKSCLRCGTRRTVFDQLRNCGICKKSICRSCRKEKSIFQLNVDTKQPERDVFCAKCLLRANLPNTKPVSLETIKKNQERAGRERSSSRGKSSTAESACIHAAH